MKHSLQFLGISALCSIAITVSVVQTHAFSDVSGNNPFSEAITSLKTRGVIEGYSDGTFRSDSTINRAEFLKIILEGRDGEDDIVGEDCFPDVTNQWFAKYVCFAEQEGIIDGYPDGTFKPKRQINFAEAGKIIALAYDQDPQQGSSVWYEKYIRALEASNAIPISIGSFEKQISRGEMTEMMWRLSEERTDRESTSYLNIKYPEVSVHLASDEPQIAKGCADIRAFLQEANQGYGGGMRMFDDAMPMAVPLSVTSGMAEESSAAKANFSETNVQVEGVDEADIVKTDGEYLYILQNSTIIIAKALPASEMKILSTLAYANNGQSFNPQELYLHDNKLIVLGRTWKQYHHSSIERNLMASRVALSIAPEYYGGNRTQIRVYDVSDTADPKLERTVSFDGSKISSRRIGDRLYLVMNQGFHWGRPVPLEGTQDASLLPEFEDSLSGSAEPMVDCHDVVILPRVPSPQYLITATIPLDDPDGEISREVIIGNGSNVYMSHNNLYVANSRYNYIWKVGASQSNEKTDIYRFAVLSDGLEFKQQGSVPGRILNQFSMDEHEGNFRIATTKGQVWDSGTPSTNNLYILSPDMDQIGEIENIAPGERIYSVRFMGDRAYMVTFKKVDPFFVIDTSNPRNPTILGKLKIPGYSDYLHPYDDNHILGFGKEAVEAKEGDFAWYQGMKIALFDVSDVSNPTEKHKITIGDRGTDSPLLRNHKALLFDRSRNLLAFPVQVSEIENKGSTTADNTHGTPVFQGAHVYDISLDNGFDLRGEITHYNASDLLKAGYSLYGKNVERIIRIGQSLYTISQDGIQSHTLDTVKKEGGIRYEEEQTQHDCPDKEDSDVFYVSDDLAICATIDFICKDGQEAFSDECGCGCLEK